MEQTIMLGVVGVGSILVLKPDCRDIQSSKTLLFSFQLKSPVIFGIPVVFKV